MSLKIDVSNKKFKIYKFFLTLNISKMASDNQLSTVLLLFALGLLIYCLTKPKTVNGTGSTKPNEKEYFAEVDEEAEETPDVAQETQVEAAVQEAVAQPETRVEAAPAQAQINGEQMDVFQFEPSDMSGQAGAELDFAFERPVPKNARPDSVDLNKNNLKNYNAKDFLPKEINDQWFDTDFSQAKYNINDDKLINTERYVIGVNTVGQSLKNASYDIRGTVANPKFTVSPWNNSTYEPDFNLKSLC